MRQRRALPLRWSRLRSRSRRRKQPRSLFQGPQRPAPKPPGIRDLRHVPKEVPQTALSEFHESLRLGGRAADSIAVRSRTGAIEVTPGLDDRHSRKRFELPRMRQRARLSSVVAVEYSREAAQIPVRLKTSGFSSISPFRNWQEEQVRPILILPKSHFEARIRREVNHADRPLRRLRPYLSNAFSSAVAFAMLPVALSS